MARSYTEQLLARPAPRPSRFRFTTRRCRRRCARGLAAGRSLAEVAAVERVAVIEIEALLGDAQFQARVAHYAAIAALPRPMRLARLAEVALEVLEHAVEAGELRVAMFVLHEQRRGRDPSMTLAEAALARIEEDPAAQKARRAPAADRSADARDGEESVGRRDAAWTHCAAAHAHVMDAEATAVHDLRTVEAGLRRQFAALAERLVTEAERAGTGLPASEALARALVAQTGIDRPDAKADGVIGADGAPPNLAGASERAATRPPPAPS